VVEEQVEIEILVADLEMILAADKGEALAKLKEKRAEIVQQAALGHCQVNRGWRQGDPRARVTV
jgi:hypothetical protein